MKKVLLFALVCGLAVFMTVQPVDAKKSSTKKKTTTTTETTKEEVVDKSKFVKVYVFEAGGCPYCEKEMEYLTSLSSYNKKFEIITKELYIDHVDWEHGKDYDLGYAVATYFKRLGFSNASYEGTPFVVISDVYAAATYSTDLENYINEAYNAGDKDIVGQIERGEIEVFTKTNNTPVIIAIAVVLVGGIAGLAYVATRDDKKRK
jgi:thiol-disulfide isomerase/thioredoxin